MISPANPATMWKARRFRAPRNSGRKIPDRMFTGQNAQWLGEVVITPGLARVSWNTICGNVVIPVAVPTNRSASSGRTPDDIRAWHEVERRDRLETPSPATDADGESGSALVMVASEQICHPIQFLSERVRQPVRTNVEESRAVTSVAWVTSNDQPKFSNEPRWKRPPPVKLSCDAPACRARSARRQKQGEGGDSGANRPMKTTTSGVPWRCLADPSHPMTARRTGPSIVSPYHGCLE